MELFASLRHMLITNRKMMKLKSRFGDSSDCKPCGAFKWVAPVARLFEAGPLGDRIGVRSVKRNDLSRKCGIICRTRYDCRCE